MPHRLRLILWLLRWHRLWWIAEWVHADIRREYIKLRGDRGIYVPPPEEDWY